MENILKIVKEKYPKFNWLDEPCQIETGEDNFLCDVETALEYDENIFDDTITIEKEICFES